MSLSDCNQRSSTIEDKYDEDVVDDKSERQVQPSVSSEQPRKEDAGHSSGENSQVSFITSRKTAGLKELSALYSSCILEENLSSLEDSIVNESLRSNQRSRIQSEESERSSISPTSFHSIFSTFSGKNRWNSHSQIPSSSASSLTSDKSTFCSTDSFNSTASEVKQQKYSDDQFGTHRESCPDISNKNKVKLNRRSKNRKMSSTSKSTPDKLDSTQVSKRKKSLISSFRKGRKGRRKSKSNSLDGSESTDVIASNEDSLDLKSDEESTNAPSGDILIPQEEEFEDASVSLDQLDEPVSIPAGESGAKHKVSKFHSVKNKMSSSKGKEKGSLGLGKSTKLCFMPKRGRSSSESLYRLHLPSADWSCSDQSSLELEIDMDECDSTDSEKTVSNDERSPLLVRKQYEKSTSPTSDAYFSVSTPPSSPVYTPPVSPVPNPKSVASRLNEYMQNPLTDSFNSGDRSDASLGSYSAYESPTLKLKYEPRVQRQYRTSIGRPNKDIIIPALRLTSSQTSVPPEKKITQETSSLATGSKCSSGSSIPKRVLTDEEVNAIVSRYTNNQSSPQISQANPTIINENPPGKLPLQTYAPFITSNYEDLPAHLNRRPTSPYKTQAINPMKPFLHNDLETKPPSPHVAHATVRPIARIVSYEPAKPYRVPYSPVAIRSTNSPTYTNLSNRHTSSFMDNFSKKPEPTLLKQYESIPSSQTSSMSTIDHHSNEISHENIFSDTIPGNDTSPADSYGGSKTGSIRRPIHFQTDMKDLMTASSLGLSYEDFDISLNSADSKSSSSAGSSGDKNEHLFKILVIGELGTGKTSIIKRYVHQFFSQHYRATIGVDFALKVLSWDSNTVIRLQLWDIAGQERFGNMTRVYYKEAVGAFIVFDVTRAQTFDCVSKWKNDLDTKVTLPNGSPIPTVLLANKCDQPKEGIVNSPARMDDYCRDAGYAGWFETSAKENVNIDEAAKFLVNQILSIEQNGLLLSESYDPDKFAIDSPGEKSAPPESNCKC